MAEASTEIKYNDPTMALMQQLLGSRTNTTQTATIDPAAQAAMQQLLSQLMAQTTPEGMQAQLAALFSEGAKQVPVLTQAYANSAGARSAGNSGLQFALGDLNTELAKQATLLATSQQQQAAQLAGSLANSSRSVNTTQKSGMGVDPMTATLLGVAANQLNKRGVFDKGFDMIGDWLSPDTTPAAALDSSAFTVSAPAYGTMGGDTGGFDLGGAFSGNYTGLVDAVTGFSDWLSTIDWGFKDGGSPRRNVADMGAQSPVVLQGALDLTPAQVQQMLAAPAPSAAQQTATKLSEKPKEAGGNESMAPGLNSDYSPALASAVRFGFDVNSALGMLGAGLPTGPVSSMVKATSPSEALGSMATFAATLANPLLGVIAGLVNKAVNTPEPKSLTNPPDDMVTNMPGRTGQGFNGRATDGGFGRDATDPDGFGNMGGGFGDHSGGGYGDGNDTSGFKDGGSPAGLLRGPGTGTSDSIKMPMASLSNGEYIVSADVVEAVGIDFLDGLQAAFHKGGAPA